MADGLPIWVKVAAFGTGCVLFAIAAINDRRKKKKDKLPSETAPKAWGTPQDVAHVLAQNAAIEIVRDTREQLFPGQSITELDVMDRLYPYVVPKTYLDEIGRLPEGYARSLGHGLYVIYVFDLDGAVRMLNTDDIQKLNSTPELVYSKAIENLEKIASERKISIKSFPTGPQGKPFMLIADHWSAATCILLPRLDAMAKHALGVNEYCIVIPHRDVMLIFPKGDENYRKEMLEFIREKEAEDCRKPLTWQLFTIKDTFPIPFTD